MIINELEMISHESSKERGIDDQKIFSFEKNQTRSETNIASRINLMIVYITLLRSLSISSIHKIYT